MLHIFILLLLATFQQESKEIHFGHGGGFSGIVYHYVLDETGQLFKTDAFSDESTLIKKIDTQVVKELFLSIEEDRLDQFTINQPGNTYKFIEIHQNGVVNKMVWNGKSENNSLNLLYTQLNTILKSKD
jgi:hypothetical protein